VLAARRRICCTAGAVTCSPGNVADLKVLASVAADVELDAAELLEAIERPELKASLRRATDQAWGLGVRGVPSISVGGRVFYGDDALEAAAASVSAV
jgi:2-hydroxychromene-2-carboxylate isomerase